MAIHFVWPVPLVPRAIGAPLGVIVIVAAAALFISAVRTFRAAGTPVPGNLPTTTIVARGALLLQPEPDLSRFLAFPAGAQLLGEQRGVADHPRAGRCAHVARGHPARGALPRSAVSRGVLAVQSFGPPLAVVRRGFGCRGGETVWAPAAWRERLQALLTRASCVARPADTAFPPHRSTRSRASLPADGGGATTPAGAAVRGPDRDGIRLLDPAVHRREWRAGIPPTLARPMSLVSSPCWRERSRWRRRPRIRRWQRSSSSTRTSSGARSHAWMASCRRADHAGARRAQSARGARHPGAARGTLPALSRADVRRRTSGDRVSAHSSEGRRPRPARDRRARGEGWQGPPRAARRVVRSPDGCPNRA